MLTAATAVRKKGSAQRVIKAVTAERFTPYALARKLQAKALLESASFKKGKERYSILLIEEAFRLIQIGSDLFFEDENARKRVKRSKKDILDVLLYFASQHPSLHQDLPLPAGGIGYLSYEFARQCDTIRFMQKEDPYNLPDGCFIFGHIFVVFDHYTDIMYILGLNYKEHSIDLDKAVRETEERINDLNFNYLAQPESRKPCTVLPETYGKESYIKGVEEVRKEITAGNLLQGVLSRRMEIETSLSALEAYKNLRSVNPSPYLFYLDFDSYQLFGSSPEMQVKVKDGKAIMRPIAGTRKRGATAEEDSKLERDLLHDEKEKAEHLMLVDLARNDLGRVCKPGSVTIPEFMGIEHYSHVMHIVSETCGILRDGITGADVIRATFPAGTVSGAPKIRAIEVIDRLEPVPRRFYAGLVGYVEPDGNMDTCITIRSALKKDGIMVIQAGAGIVMDSVPEKEYEETCSKLRATAASIGVEV